MTRVDQVIEDLKESAAPKDFNGFKTLLVELDRKETKDRLQERAHVSWRVKLLRAWQLLYK